MGINKSPYRVHLALFFVQLGFAGLHVFGKAILSHFEPFVVAGLRVSFAAPILFLIAYSVDRLIPCRRDLLHLALLGLFGVCFNQLLYINGLKLTTATNASILMPAIPIFAMALAVLSGVEKGSLMKMIGMALAVAGALVMLDLSGLSLHRGTVVGNMLILLNNLSFAIFLVISKPVLKRLPPLTVIAWTYIFGGLGILIVTVPHMIRFPFSQVPEIGYVGMAYIIIFPTIICYFLNTWAIKKSTPSLVATYITLQPVAATLLALLLLGETFGVKEVLGFLLIIAGLFVVSKRSANADPA